MPHTRRIRTLKLHLTALGVLGTLLLLISVLVAPARGATALDLNQEATVQTPHGGFGAHPPA